MKTINASQLKALYNKFCAESEKEANWFSRGNMEFAGDTMANFCVTKHERAFDWFNGVHVDVYGINRKCKTSEGFPAGHVSYFSTEGKVMNCIALPGEDKYIAMTRSEYMTDSNFEKHHTYYSQFVTEGVKQRVRDAVCIDKLAADLAEGDIHLNKSYSCAKVWDRIMMVTPAAIYNKIKLAGENNSISTQVCIVKAAARILIDELKSTK